MQQLQAAVAQDVQASSSLQAFCTRSCCIRYLRARSWNVPKATKMLKETLAWRTSYKPEQIRWEDVAAEAADGKMWVLEHPDKEGRPVVLMRPRNDTSHNNEARIRHLVYTLEQASRLADEWGTGDGKMAWLVDFVGYTRKNAPPIRVALHTLHVLQNHYPERLGKAVSYIPPLIFDLMWRAVSPFIDPVTHKKLVFLNKKAAAAGHLADHFDLQHLDDTLGGAVPLAQAFNIAQLEQRYRAADAAVDRQLLAQTQGVPGAAAMPAAPAAAPVPAGVTAAAGLHPQGEEEAPSPGVSESSLGDEGSASVATGSASVPSMRSTLEGDSGRATPAGITGAMGTLRVDA